jgi:hypothetical protein
MLRRNCACDCDCGDCGCLPLGPPRLALTHRHPLNLYAGLLPSYPGEGFGGGFGPVGQKAKIL